MPNTRRRRFSVQNKIATSTPSSLQNDTPHSRKINPENARNMKQRNKFSPNFMPHANTLEIVSECDSATSFVATSATQKNSETESATTTDKDVTASSSNIDFFALNSMGEGSIESSREIICPVDSQQTIQTNDYEANKQTNRDKMALKKEKVPRPHRVKVRSPKRSVVIVDANVLDVSESRRSIAVDTIDWSKDVKENIKEDVPIPNANTEVVTNVVEAADEIRESEHSLYDMCRICHGGESLSAELGSLISACSCRGTVARVHVKCLERWLTESGKSRCELCGTRYSTRRVHRYGVPRALAMWILSQNAKQLMVDSLGIMLMSPLAVLAAWLSGRTLAGLMTQESHVTPWPLASTFVLACMTLVCYYCWIVSAATRHALSWWIWYRSQYEVRLQLQESEE